MLESILKKCPICGPARLALDQIQADIHATATDGGSTPHVQAEVICDYCDGSESRLTPEGEVLKGMLTVDLRKRLDALESFALQQNEKLANEVGITITIPF